MKSLLPDWEIILNLGKGRVDEVGGEEEVK